MELSSHIDRCRSRHRGMVHGSLVFVRLASLLFLFVLLLPTVLLPSVLTADESRSATSPRPPNWFAYLQRHCLDCHGPDLQEGGLRLDELARDLPDLATERRWTRVLEKVERGEMPPADQPRPGAADTVAFRSALHDHLHRASLARQQREGRVVIRRLNRTEHETTLRDLLGSQVDILDVLPEDGLAAGFDKVSEALDVSADHLLRYQEAAEVAVRSVVPRREPERMSARRTGREAIEASRTATGALDKYVRFEGDAMVFHSRPSSSVSFGTNQAVHPGRYRVRVAVRPVGPVDERFPVLLQKRGGSTRFPGENIRMHDVRPGRVTVIEDHFEMGRRESVSVNSWTLPSSRELASKLGSMPLAQYSGPGLAVEWLEIEGPLEDFPSLGYRRLFGDVPLARRVSWNANSLAPSTTRPREDAERLIRDLLPVAFRRPVSPTLERYFVAHAHYELEIGSSFEEAMIMAYTAIFSSPYFLYLIEPLRESEEADSNVEGTLSAAMPHSARRTELDDYAVASRLSYFLWSSLPDAELLQLAEQKRLRDSAVLHEQVERMLADPRSKRLTRNFAGQWLDLREIDATNPDPRIYGEFDNSLFWSMPRETEAFFEEVLKHDLPVTDFVHSSWTFLNQRLAQHYGIPGVWGGELRKVELPPNSRRGGLLTQAAILKVTADGTRTSPILRGVWVLDRILGQEPPPPPSGVAAVEPDIRGTTTIREQLAKHRDDVSCASCHQYIDPPGFALESFDPIGGWRDFYRGIRQQRVPLANYPDRTVPRGMDVEMGGELADGRTFRDIDEYKQLLVAERVQIARNLAGKLITYATGADIQLADREVVEEIVAQSREKEYGFRSLLHAIVQSRIFLSK